MSSTLMLQAINGWEGETNLNGREEAEKCSSKRPRTEKMKTRGGEQRSAAETEKMKTRRGEQRSAAERKGRRRTREKMLGA